MRFDPVIEFPDPAGATSEGLLGHGGELSPDWLLSAYAQGIFPWFSEGDPVLWWSPDPRMVLFPERFHCSRRLARRIRQGIYRTSFDADFAGVIRECAAPRDDDGGTWILPEMIGAYERLHALGYAHSVEVWHQERLIGGLYGVRLGRIFFAESMFSRRIDASKVALAFLCEKGVREGWAMIDCQFHTEHLQSLGACEIPRDEFLRRLRDAL